MKNIIYIFLFVLSATLFGTIFTFAEEEILPLATGEWPPYTSQNMEGYGFCTQIVSAVIHEMGMKPEFHFYPWKRAELITAKGQVFGVFPYAVTEERQKDFDFSEILLKNKTVFFYYKPHMKKIPKWAILEDLLLYRIGGVLGYSYVQAFERAGLKVEYVIKEELNVLKLRRGRLDLIVMEIVVGQELIKKLYPQSSEKFGILDPPLSSGNSHLMISRKYPGSSQLKDRFNRALKQIKENGKYQTIIEKYGIRPER